MSDTTTETYVRYYREYRDGRSFDGGWFRTGRSAADGYATAEEAVAEPRYDRPYTDTRVVVVTTTVTTEDIDDD